MNMTVVFVVLRRGHPECAFRTEKAATAHVEAAIRSGKGAADVYRIIPCELYGESKPAGTGIPLDETPLREKKV